MQKLVIGISKKRFWTGLALQKVTSALQVVTKEQMGNGRVIFHRLAKEGILERDPKLNGRFRLVNKECEKMDFLSVGTDIVYISLPFGLNNMVEIMPGNIILIAGEPNAGKTALLLNIIRHNIW